MVTVLIEPFGRATRAFIASTAAMGTAFAKWPPQGSRVIFAPKSPCVHDAFRMSGNISSIPDICQIGEKRAVRQKNLPISHIDRAEWAAITETGIICTSAADVDVELPSYQIFPVLLFSSKNGLPSFSHGRWRRTWRPI